MSSVPGCAGEGASRTGHLELPPAVTPHAGQLRTRKGLFRSDHKAVSLTALGGFDGVKSSRLHELMRHGRGRLMMVVWH